MSCVFKLGLPQLAVPTIRTRWRLLCTDSVLCIKLRQFVVTRLCVDRLMKYCSVYWYCRSQRWRTIWVQCRRRRGPMLSPSWPGKYVNPGSACKSCRVFSVRLLITQASQILYKMVTDAVSIVRISMQRFMLSICLKIWQRSVSQVIFDSTKSLL